MKMIYVYWAFPLVLISMVISNDSGESSSVKYKELVLPRSSVLILQKSVVQSLVLSLSQLDVFTLNMAIDLVFGGIRDIPEFVEITMPPTGMYVISLEGIAMRGLTNLRRGGDLTVSSTMRELDLSVPVKLTDFQIHIDQCKVYLWLYNTNGSMTITIDTISFTTHLRFSAVSECALNIRRVEMNQLTGININTYGNTLLGLAARYARYEEDVKRIAQRGIDKAIKQMVKDRGNVVCSTG